MPTYEFRCPDGTIIERVFKMSEVPDAIPSPKGDGMAQRIISGGGELIFKGSGFYITDYGKDGKKAERSGVGGRGSEEGRGSGVGKTESAKSEAPGAKPESKESTKKDPAPPASGASS
jgi:predicted nucleic acid-binding Zn ribbon protein